MIITKPEEGYPVAEDKTEFESLYEQYRKKLEEISGGLVTTDKAEFYKMYAFVNTVVYPPLKENFEQVTKVLLKR
jgi:hypothetical protein